MGMYTGLRCKLIVKPEFRGEIRRLLEEVEWEDLNYPIFKTFGTEFSRSSFIPLYGTWIAICSLRVWGLKNKELRAELSRRPFFVCFKTIASLD